MPSPFPGMDPWLESPAVFPDFHTTFINYLREALNVVLPAPFYAGVSTRVWLEDSERRVEPDVDVLKRLNGPASYGVDNSSGVATLEPTTELLEIIARMSDEEMTETFVEIFSAPGNAKLVASIELLSPSNKTPGSGGRDLFRAKQQEMYHAGVHMVEIDLLRRGTHATLVPLALLKKHAGAYDYHVCLHRADRWNAYYVAALKIHDKLPTIPIWLTPDVPPVTLDLQTVLNASYDKARYARRIDYAQPADPPLTDDQTKWADEILRQKGLLVSS